MIDFAPKLNGDAATLDAQREAFLRDHNGVAAANTTVATSASTESSSGGAPALSNSWWTVHDAMTISAVVLIFGIAVVAIAGYLIRHERDGQVILRVLGTMLVLVFAVFLIVAGYSNEQITPVIGLLGTIAGYLLGRDASAKPETASEPPRRP